MASTHHPQYYRIPPASARRLLVLRHGPSARLQGVAIVADYEPPVQRSAYGRRDPRFDFCRRNPRFCRTPFRLSLALACPADPRTLYQQDRNQHCNCPYPPHQHTLRYGRSGQAPIYLDPRTHGHWYRTVTRDARSQRGHVTERSATEFIELYVSTTPMHSSHCSTPQTYPSPGRTCTHSVSAIAVEHLLLS